MGGDDGNRGRLEDDLLEGDIGGPATGDDERRFCWPTSEPDARVREPTITGTCKAVREHNQ